MKTKMKMKITETQMKNKVEVDMRRIEPENTYSLITALDSDCNFNSLYHGCA